jgi:very-short-patch-repair endonuclease
MRIDAVNALAARQHGVVTRAQLIRAGLSRDIIDNRVKARWLRPVHRGVYCVGPLAAPYMREMAAVLACGEEAVVSHRSASALWQLLPHAPDNHVHISLQTGRTIRRSGIRIHRVASLPRAQMTRVQSIPVTTPARTLLDLAAIATPRELEQAMARAERRELASANKLLSLLALYPRHRGTRHLTALLQRHERPRLTRSQAEELLLALIGKAELPAPDVNVRVGPYEVDLLWREAGLVVEVDGFAFHADWTSFEADRRRDAELAARGLTVIRVTWRQVVDEPEAMLTRIAQALAVSRARRRN